MTDEFGSSEDPQSQSPEVTAKGEDQRWLTAGVGSVAAASFFSDSGREIATSVLPSFLTSVLHGSAAALGLIEGVSDALTGVAKDEAIVFNLGSCSSCRDGCLRHWSQR